LRQSTATKVETRQRDDAWLNPKHQGQWAISSQARNGRFNDYLITRVRRKRLAAEAADIQNG